MIIGVSRNDRREAFLTASAQDDKGSKGRGIKGERSIKISFDQNFHSQRYGYLG
jgi:hypothetical protein